MLTSQPPAAEPASQPLHQIVNTLLQTLIRNQAKVSKVRNSRLEKTKTSKSREILNITHFLFRPLL